MRNRANGEDRDRRNSKVEFVERVEQKSGDRERERERESLTHRSWWEIVFLLTDNFHPLFLF